MTNEQKDEYLPASALRGMLKKLAGQKFKLDCGHHVTIGHNFGNNIVVINGKQPKIVCSRCGY